MNKTAVSNDIFLRIGQAGRVVLDEVVAIYKATHLAPTNRCTVYQHTGTTYPAYTMTVVVTHDLVTLKVSAWFCVKDGDTAWFEGTLDETANRAQVAKLCSLSLAGAVPLYGFMKEMEAWYLANTEYPLPFDDIPV